MFRKMLGVFTALLAALVVVGVAWASSGAPSSTTVGGDEVTSTSSDRPSSSTTDGSTTSILSSTSSTSPDSTSTTSPGSTSTTVPGSTSTTVDNTTTSTTIPGSSTSTTIDDEEDVPDGDYAFQVATAATVVIRVTNGDLSLLTVTANSGWSFEVEKDRSDVVEVEFTKAESEASIRVEPGDGALEVEIEFKSN